MRILMFGKTGQVARELIRAAGQGADTSVIALDRAQADLRDADVCAARIAEHAASVDVVINAAAYTAVDKAEVEPDLAQAINGDAPGRMAQACARAGLPFLHISTDYVFNGAGTTPWSVDDATAPLGVYGRTKLNGERQIAAAFADADARFAILRTAWVFSAHGSNFVKTMLRLSESRDTLNVVGDQIGGPTPARAIADALIVMAQAFVRAGGKDRTVGGIYHFAGAPSVSWAEFAREIFRQAQRDVRVSDIPSSAYPTPAARPLNSRLACGALARDFAIAQPDWRAGLADVLRDLQTPD